MRTPVIGVADGFCKENVLLNSPATRQVKWQKNNQSSVGIMVTVKDFASALIMVTVIFGPHLIVSDGGKNTDSIRGTRSDFLYMATSLRAARSKVKSRMTCFLKRELSPWIPTGLAP